MHHKKRIEVIKEIITLIRLGTDLSMDGGWLETGRVGNHRVVVLQPSRGSKGNYRVWIEDRTFIIDGSSNLFASNYDFEELFVDILKTLERVVANNEKGRPTTVKIGT